MGAHTLIGWCDSTINGSSGCDGCELYQRPPATVVTKEQFKAWLREQPCYAAQVHEHRWGTSLAITHPHLYSRRFYDVRMIPGRFAIAANWSDLRGTDRKDKPWMNGRPRHIFVGDMGDFLSRNVTDEFLEKELLAAVKSEKGRRHVWMWLTKRPKRLAELSEKWGGLPENVIAMTTVTTQRTADIRVPELLKVRCHLRGVSIEPMLGPVSLTALPFVHGGYNALKPYRPEGCTAPQQPSIDGVICGCESGPKRRPMETAWALSLRKQCADAGRCFFMKQIVVGGKVVTDMDAFPAELRVRELPEVRR